MECEKYSCTNLQEASCMTPSIIKKKNNDIDVASLVILSVSVLKRSILFS